MRLVAAGAEDGSADGQDSRERIAVESESVVFDQAAEAIAKADDLHAVIAQAGLADAADGSVKAGAVATGGEDADAAGLGFAHR